MMHNNLICAVVRIKLFVGGITNLCIAKDSMFDGNTSSERFCSAAFTSLQIL